MSKMKRRYIFVLFLVAKLIVQHGVYSETWAVVKTEVASLVYDTSYDGLDAVRPTADSTIPMDVTIDWNMISINDFDETNGYIEVSGFATLEWIADAYDASTMEITELLRNEKMWTPSVVLVNALKSYEAIGYDTSVKVRVNLKTKTCKWQPRVITRVACSPNVQYYPFDRQTCVFRFAAWGYNDSEVKLTAKNSEWGFLYFEENGEWEVEETSSDTTVVGDSSTVDFKIVIVRRPLYYVINLIAPVILLGVLNAFAFLLPAESGERVGFSITCFLAYVVLLNTIMGFLPTSASPLSYLSYYTFIMMMYSAGVSLMTIVTIRIHYKSEHDQIPRVLCAFYRCFTCRICDISSPSRVHVRRSLPTNQVEKFTQDCSSSWDVPDNAIDKHETVSESTECATEDTVEDEVSWKKIAAFLDFLLFLGFLGAQVFFSVAYLVPIFIN